MSFWQAPPWQGGVAKQRLGLQPMDVACWLTREPVQGMNAKIGGNIARAFPRRSTI